MFGVNSSLALRVTLYFTQHNTLQWIKLTAYIFMNLISVFSLYFLEKIDNALQQPVTPSSGIK